MKKTFKKGFTIIELLIVIVVIGILAGIVTVTYNGVQDKARLTKSEQVAREIANKAAAYQAASEDGDYPTLAKMQDQANVPKEAKLGKDAAAVIVSTAVPAPTNSNDAPTADQANKANAIHYRSCVDSDAKTTGIAVYYYDHTTKKATTKPVIVGDGCQ